MSTLIACDTFIKFLKLQLTGKATVAGIGNTQADINMNGVSLKFVTDRSVVGSKVWRSIVSIDIYTDDSNTDNVTPERKALTLIEEVVKVLEAGKTDQVYVNGVWVNGYISWPVEELSFKDISHDSYVHKNLMLPITYFR